MRITHEEAPGQPQGGLLGRALRRGRASEARKRVADDGCHHDGVPCLPVPRRTGSPLDWRGILARLAPVRHRWDLAILANLAGDVDSPADLLEVINGQAENGRQLSPQVLSGRLRELEQRGYISHEDLSVIPMHRVYYLRSPGQRLIEDLGSIVRPARMPRDDFPARASTATGR